MPLPTFADAKEYLRIEHADEDVLITKLVARAKASIETFIGYPFVAAEQTYVEYFERYERFVQLPGPFALLPTPPVVTDASGTTIDVSSYDLDPRGGKIRLKPGGFSFGTNRPFTVVATIGLSAHPDYAARLEAVAATAILDLVAHVYQNRNPAAESESDEGGSSLSLTPDAIPLRIVQDLLMLPCTTHLLVA